MVVADGEVSNLFHLALSGLGQALAPREVEAQVAFLVERATLGSLVAEHLVQGGVDDVGTGVCLLTVAAALHVNLCHNIGTDVSLTLAHDGAVNAQALDGLLNVLDVNDEAVTGNHTGVGCLATGLGVERGFVQDDLDLVAGLGGGRRNTPSSRMARSSVSVRSSVYPVKMEPRSSTSLRSSERSAKGALLSLGVSLCAVALLGHQLAEGLLVNLHAGLGGHLEGQVNREAVGVVQREGLGAGKRSSSRPS